MTRRYRIMPTAVLARASMPPRLVKAQATEGRATHGGDGNARGLSSHRRRWRFSVAISAAGASFVRFGTWIPPSRYMPGVVTRPFTSEPAAASLAESPACVPRSSSDDSVAFLASAVALA